ncbi:winged helix-turn-helix transcriptional regulator [Candidatus Woesearchaeota archaeon]|nr:winged helix-turn-helix transcriptional regulator [Candidatus Woesearchaeota archaeon]
MPFAQRITIIRTTTRTTGSINDEIKWLGHALGLFSLRDRESSCYRIFVELLKGAKQQQPLSSDELAHRLGLSRGTVMHHMNRLMEAGLVTMQRNKYALRDENLEVVLADLRRDMEKAFGELQKMAKRIDKELGI